jgi:hypothetical protein
LIYHAPMKRRAFLIVPLAFAGDTAMADLPKVQSLDESLRWIDRLERASSVSASGAWPLGAVLEHLAQSIEMSMEGYPSQKSRLFQGTAGTAAFAIFKWRGKMSHGLADPIPGAPALAAGANWKPAAVRLRQAIVRFNAHAGVLHPHFAYGALGKAEFGIAHALHIANHQDEIRVA